MVTPIHLFFDTGIYFLINKVDIIDVNRIDLFILFSSELIDLDHLFSKPIYHSRRNPFKTHIFHKKWRIILIISILLLFYRPIMFLGIGLLSHILLDYLYIKIYKL